MLLKILLIFLILGVINCSRFCGCYTKTDEKCEGTPDDDSYEKCLLENREKCLERCLEKKVKRKPEGRFKRLKNRIKKTVRQLKTKITNKLDFLQKKLTKAYNLGRKVRESLTNPPLMKPMIFIAGAGGTRLLRKVNFRKHTSRFCKRHTDKYQGIWFYLNKFNPFTVHCFINDIELEWDKNGERLQNKTGIEIKTEKGLESIDFLDASKKLLKYKTIQFGLLSNAFMGAGYTKDKNVVAFPYDWRLAAVQQDFLFKDLRKQVEKLYRENSRRRVMIMSHSLGCLMTLRFLNLMPTEWKNKYIDQWIPVGGPLAGAATPIKALLSGYDLSIPLLKNKDGRRLMRTFPSTYWVLPNKYLSGQVHVKANNKKYGANDIRKLFKDARLNNLIPIYDKVKHLTSDLTAPQVKVNCFYGIKQKTEVGFDYNSNYNKIKKTYFGDGDGTVPAYSASIPRIWKDKQSKSVKVHPIKANHRGLLNDFGVIEYVLREAFKK